MEHLSLRSEVLEWKEVEGEIVALDLRTSTYVAINRTGASLWPLLVEGATHEMLVQRLVERFGVAPTVAAADLDSFLDQLRRQNLITAS
jgi:hypothetical protein